MRAFETAAVTPRVAWGLLYHLSDLKAKYCMICRLVGLQSLFLDITGLGCDG